MHFCSNGTRIQFEEGTAYFVCLTPDQKIALEAEYFRARQQEIIGMFYYIPPLRPKDKECSFTTFVPGGRTSRFRILIARTKDGTVYNSQVLVNRAEPIVLQSRANPKDTLEFRIDV